MADDEIAEIAFERAWRVYQLLNSNVDEQSDRYATLERFIRKRCEAGATEAEAVVVEALIHLKQLDSSGGR